MTKRAARWHPGRGTDAHPSPPAPAPAPARAVVGVVLLSVLASCAGPAHEAGPRDRVGLHPTSSTTGVPTTTVPTTSATTVPEPVATTSPTTVPPTARAAALHAGTGDDGTRPTPAPAPPCWSPASSGWGRPRR